MTPSKEPNYTKVLVDYAKSSFRKKKPFSAPSAKRGGAKRAPGGSINDFTNF